MKKLFINFVVVLVVFSFVSVDAVSAMPSSKPFSDVRHGSETNPTPYWSAINWAFNNGVIEGYADGTFRPDQCVTRAEFLKLLTETSPLPFEPGRAGGADRFPDVNSNDWFYAYVGNAVTLSWVEGYPDGTFRPHSPVNRVEALKMALWGFNIDHYSRDTGWAWSDVVPGTWYFPYFFAALDKNLLPLAHARYSTLEGGMPSNFYYPDGCMNRAEVVELLSRARAMRDHGLQSYTDNLQPFNFR
jgi:hypothetical protein